ncbi:hypothetical protein [uncultured Sphingomonas sp.]|jgi:hypothetical protein|uniref:hypothetical protein n=1 Tax=uncultured Sphingomonas sp. TaxID=158754 RepID=UPI0025849167|nr:hypothetical protein [uncultured Sphingomonas sp.]
MKVPHRDKDSAERAQADQVRQRVRVGMSGLAAIVLLIGLASAVFSSVDHDASTKAAAGATDPAGVVTNQVAPAPAPSASNEPLAELGVTPAAANTPAPAASPSAAH